jgi:hypothetical protein
VTTSYERFIEICRRQEVPADHPVAWFLTYADAQRLGLATHGVHNGMPFSAIPMLQRSIVLLAGGGTRPLPV